jgi:ribosomal protein S18 acetylase RimI-like enzyme
MSEDGQIIIEPARKGDASDIAVLTDTAAHGLPAHFWATANDRKRGVSLLDIGRERVLRDDANFSWRNTWVARIDGDVAGAVLGYRQTEDFSKLDIDALPELVRPLVELEAEAPDCWYLNFISVHPEHRSRGIGALLIDKAVECARDTGAGEIALIVEDINEAARRFYARMGFRERASRVFVPFPMSPPANEWILTVRTLDG